MLAVQPAALLGSLALQGDPTVQVPELHLLVRCVRFRLLTTFLLFTFPSKVFLFLEQLPRWLDLGVECRACMACLECLDGGLGFGLELELGWLAWLQLRQ